MWFESSYCQRYRVSFLKRALRPPIATFTEEYRTSMIISNFCDLTSLRNRGRYPIFLSKQEKQRKISELLIQARLYVDFYYEKQVVCGCRNLTNQCSDIFCISAICDYLSVGKSHTRQFIFDWTRSWSNFLVVVDSPEI